MSLFFVILADDHQEKHLANLLNNAVRKQEYLQEQRDFSVYLLFVWERNMTQQYDFLNRYSA